MSTAALPIIEKVKEKPVTLAQLDNFVLGVGENIPEQVVVENPNISLYCLDDINKVAVFVETPPEVDLAQAPFYYMAQYDHALRLITVPYEQFHQLADDVRCGSLILIYSTGRCGSTLISQAMSTVDGLVSLSEPDVYTQLYLMCFQDKGCDEESTRLLKSCTRLFCKDNRITALKFRAQCIHIGDLLYKVFPDARNLFLYRNAEAWARSMGLETEAPEERRKPLVEWPLFRRGMAPLSLPFAARHGREATEVEFFALIWLSLMERYRSFCAQDVPFLAFRYEDILKYPKPILTEMFDYCGLSEADIETAYSVFSKDSQEGTVLSRASRGEQTVVPLDAVDYAQFRAVFHENAGIQSADYVVPNTFVPGD